MQVGWETRETVFPVADGWLLSPPSNPVAQPRQAVETTKPEYGRGRGIFGGAVKCVEIGKNTNGESTLLEPRAVAGDKPEECEDDVKSSCPLCPGRHTCYNGRDKGPGIASNRRPPYGGEFIRALHTARHTTGAGHAQSRYLNRKKGDAEGRASDWSEVVTRIDGAIWVRSNVYPTFDSLVGFGRSGGDHHGSSLLENPYIPYQCMDSYLSSTSLGSASMGK
ncbi:hypothetical protein R3W88_029620 [Solanum pinnatisectum]|uniref:Uncharacterized protein ycf68 n=1 Tax=Solanum pinnatisectum TaxID=50273 RepID=A0AAV9K852_9SOLN|nr:hypothetical protein R3W88_029620 [Solanum pinnatisectum]